MKTVQCRLLGILSYLFLGNQKMGLLMELHNRLKNSSFVLVCVFLVAYFLYHTVNGVLGVLRYMLLKKEIAQAEKIAESYHKQKLKLEDKVRLLSSSSLDLDMLEERAREVLNFASEYEFIILDEASEL